MQKPCLLIYVDDLASRSLIEEVAEAKKIDAYFATHGEQLTQLSKTIVPFMAIFDLTADDTEWLFRHIGSIRNMRPEMPMVALVLPMQDEVRDRAEKYGCSKTIDKPGLEKTIAKMIEHYLIQSGH